MVELLSLANGGNRASVVSADGNVIAGFAQGSSSRTPARWDGNANGWLLDPPDGDATGEVWGMNDAGTILMGDWNQDAFLWTEIGGIEILGSGGQLPSWASAPMDIDDAGNVVGFDRLLGNRRAWIKPVGEDYANMNTWVTDNGGTIPGGIQLEVCSAITPDGTVIIGQGFGNAWRIVVAQDTCAADVVADSTVNVLDLLEVLANWGTDGPGAGLAEPLTIVNVLDILEVLANWGPCP